MKEEQLPLPKVLLEQMANTEQNPRYHAEGSVLIHTEMVLQRFKEMQDEFELNGSEKKVMYWASILHDIGKTITTRFEDGRWRSPGHERVGLPMAQNILLQQSDLSDEERHMVLDLVRWHGFPLKWMLHQGSMDKLKELGTRTNLRLLAIFCTFDIYGRICEVQDESNALIDTFRTQSVPQAEYELGKFEGLQSKYQTWNLRQKNAAWNALKMHNVKLLTSLLDSKRPPDYRNLGKKVFLTVGPPACGKTAWLAEHEPDLYRVDLAHFGFGAELLESDYLLGRKMVEFKHSLVIFLNRHRRVVLDGDNLIEVLRLKLNDLVRSMEIELEYLVFEPSLDGILDMNKRCEAPQAEDVLRLGYAQIEKLHPWEAHRMRFIKI